MMGLQTDKMIDLGQATQGPDLMLGTLVPQTLRTSRTFTHELVGEEEVGGRGSLLPKENRRATLKP